MESARRPTVVAAALATAGAATLWGTSFIANDVGLRGADPYAFTAVRFVVAAASAWLVLRVVEPEAARRPPLRAAFGWLAGALTAGAFLLQYLGQERTTPGRAALFVNANVFTVALLQAWVHRDRPTRGMLAAAAVAVAGVLLLTTGGRAGAITGGTILGDALTFAGGATWAVYLVACKGFLRAHSPLAATTWTFVATSLVAAPIALVAGGVPQGALSWGAIVYAGLACSTVAYVVWTWGLRTLSATTSAVILLIEVPVAAALSVALGLDRVTLPALAGAALLFGGVAAASWLEARREPGPAG